MNPNFSQQADNLGGTPSSQGFGYPQMPSGQAGFPQSYPQIPGYTPLPGYQPTPGAATVPQLPFLEQSYIENILRLNRGKMATVYMNFDNSQWGSKIFKGIIEAAGKDHIILSDPVTGMRYLLLTIYLNYITFDEEIAYDYPYAFGLPQELGTAAPIYNAPTPTTQFRKKDQNTTTNSNNKNK